MSRKIPEKDEILAALRHRYADLRAQAVSQLNVVPLDRITVETVLRAKLSDPDYQVRVATYEQVGSMKMTALVPDLIPLLDAPQMLQSAKQEGQSSELFYLCEALENLKDPRVLDKMLKVLVDPRFDSAFEAGRVLESTRSATIPKKLITLIDTHRTWAALNKSEIGQKKYDGDLRRRFDVLIETLISYRDRESVPVLKSVILDRTARDAGRYTLKLIANLTDKDKITQDPFVLSFRDVALSLVGDPWGDEGINFREPALVLAVRAGQSKEQSVALLKSGLGDDSVYVRLVAAQEAAALGLKSLLPDIKLAATRSDEGMQEYFCKAAEALAGSCK